ncbi:MAG TPA: hypothetical protein VFZ59_03595 [Verrucomicrobiae bacterium]|nr:hypothetical protein [Verrucomicrobiae bacterium]
MSTTAFFTGLFILTTTSSINATTFVVTNAADNGDGSLRQAILSANSTAGVADVINFNIPGTAPHSINPVTPLPIITSPVVIDGYSQPGASPNTLANSDNAVLKIVVLESLVIATTNSIVRGLVIPQIQIGDTPNAKGSNVVEGCFIGLDATGTNSLGSPGFGVFVQTPNNRIGGTTPAARNIISGKGGVGIEIFEVFATNNVIQGNFIGTDRTGTKAIGNGDRAVQVNMNASATTIGGPFANARNVISGNLDRGITLDGSDNRVYGNFIGTDVTGLLPLGNARTGVEIGGSNNRIGDNSANGNVIAFNGISGGGIFTTNGVDIKPGVTAYIIRGNSIFENKGLGIDVNADTKVTPGFPVLTLVSNATTATLVRGTFTPNTTLGLELFSNSTVDPSGHGEGKKHLITTAVTTDASSNFSLTLPSPVTPGLFVSAIANGNTEFSQSRMVVAAGSINNWTNSVSGKWENGTNWSLNVPPYVGHSLVAITNAGSKTVINDATTASEFPSTMTISNLVIGAPSGATNTLLLAPGTNTPFRLFNALNVNSGGALVISNAALSLEGNFNGSSRIDGTVTLLDGSLISTNSNNRTYIGHSGRGTLTISNGTFESYYPIVALGDNSFGTWNIAGGVTRVTATFDIADSLTATGRVVMTDGELHTPSCYVGLFGNGSMVVSNGYLECEGQILLGSQAGSVGNLALPGGFTFVDSVVVSEGFQSTGNLLTSGDGVLWTSLVEARTGGTFRMDGGSVLALSVIMSGTSQFVFNQGTLYAQSVVMSNNAPFVVGDGTNAAEYMVYSEGTNIFPKGVRVAPHSSLTGEGIIPAMVTNSGVIDPGYDYGSLGTLEIRGGLVLSNNAELHFEVSGDADEPCDFLASSGNVVLGGKLSVSFPADYDGPALKRARSNPAASSSFGQTAYYLSRLTNGASFTVMTNNNNFTGAFTNVPSGGLLTTTDGYGRFTVLYAGSKTLRLTDLVILDSDSDGMPNWWEDEYGLDKNVADAAIDTDGDGASNIAEYHAGTQPNNYDSAFRIVSFQRETNNTRITWTTVLGKSYRVQTNAPVNGGLSTNFYDVSPLIAAPTDGNESTTNFVHVGAFTNAPAGYYRVRVGP